MLKQHPPADLQEYRQRELARHPPPDEPKAGTLLELPGPAGEAAAARRVQGLDAPYTEPQRNLPEPEDDPQAEYWKMFEEAKRRRGER